VSDRKRYSTDTGTGMLTLYRL